MSTREQVVRNAEKYVAKGKIDAAIKEYLKVLKENPNDVSTLNRLGDLYARVSRIDEAVRLFTQIAEQYTEDGFLVKAIAIYKKIIKLDPTRLQVYENLAGLYHKQGLVNEARTQYQVLGDYYLKHNDAASAINIYQKMAELEPDNPSHHLKLAELFQQGQLWDKALRSYRTIAELMLQHERVDEAVRVYQRAIEVHSQDLAFITDAVVGLRDAGHTAASARLLATAVEANPAAEAIGRLAGVGQPAPPAAGDRDTLPPAAEPAPQAAATAAQPQAEELAPPPALPDLDDDVFVLDVDDDFPSSRVAPPADMVEPGSAFQRPAPSPGAEGPGARAADAGFAFELPELDMPALDEAEIELPGLDAPAAPEAAPGRPPTEPAGRELAGQELAGGDLQLPEVDADAWTVESAELELPPLDEELAGPRRDAAAGPQPPSEPEHELELPWEAAEPAAAGAVAGHLGMAETEELEVDLSELGLEAPAAGEPPPAWVQEPPPAGELGADAAGFEMEVEPLEPEPAPAARAAAPAPAAAPPPEPPRLQDLLAEAEVFAKYGLEEKALERLDQVLTGEPEHLEALQLLLDLQLKAGDRGRVDATVRRLRDAIGHRGADDVWQRVQARLARAGIAVDGGAPPAAPKPSEERVSQLLKSLVDQPAAPAAQKPAAARKRSIDDALAELTSGVRAAPRPARPAAATPAAAPPSGSAPAVPPAAVPPAARPVAPAAAAASATAPAAAAAPPVAPVAPGGPAFQIPADFEDELPDIVLPEERKPAAGRDLDDSSMDWLRESPAPAGAAEEKLFDEEDEFFDLAAELEEELGVEERKLRGDVVQAEEPSLEEIVEGFKKGVAENLSPEDYDTHYNLGIAYREMGLLDEAIGEFQLASKDPAHLVDCCSMLGVSFLEKGLPELAVKWYQRGLAAPDIREEVMLSLLYDMGNVYMSMGDAAAARKTFVELYGISSHYRDVVAKIEELNR